MVIGSTWHTGTSLSDHLHRFPLVAGTYGAGVPAHSAGARSAASYWRDVHHPLQADPCRIEGTCYAGFYASVVGQFSVFDVVCGLAIPSALVVDQRDWAECARRGLGFSSAAAGRY